MNRIPSSTLGGIIRLEVINDTECDACTGSGIIRVEGGGVFHDCPTCHGTGLGGRKVVFNSEYKQARAYLDDSGKTLKIFVTGRES